MILYRGGRDHQTSGGTEFRFVQSRAHLKQAMSTLRAMLLKSFGFTADAIQEWERSLFAKEEPTEEIKAVAIADEALEDRTKSAWKRCSKLPYPGTVRYVDNVPYPHVRKEAESVFRLSSS